MKDCCRNPQRLRLVVRGAVQGVGFRPYIYRLALGHGLSGRVWNSSDGVVIEVQGSPEALESFTHRLPQEKPGPAIISSVSSTEIPAIPETGFLIARSREGAPDTLITPDLAVCRECIADVRNPENRRYRYPFTNCTNCGPRYSILLSLPYDRPNTTMRGFAMCPECASEYADPNDRRFHAQPVACPVCGPRLSLLNSRGDEIASDDAALRAAVEAILGGMILALKGLGGFQLLVRADSDSSVALLRTRKNRPAKPLALLVQGIREAGELCLIEEGEEELLLSPAAPITLLRWKGHGVSTGVAPGSSWLGLMLPATPLHHLVASDAGVPLVATSGNASGEPICIDEREALIKLRGTADLFLVHNRPIARQVDDSVVGWLPDGPLTIRRARGYAPLPVKVAGMPPGVVAVGGHMANTVAVSISGGVVMSQHIGDLDSLPSVEAHSMALRDLQHFFGEGRLVVRDLHPDYASTAAAETMGVPSVVVQHHHAHVLGCMAENGAEGPVLGVAWDGVGLGDDLSAWGGEFLAVGDASSFERIACLRSFPLPGGDAAAFEPRRSALGILWEIHGELPSSPFFEPSQLRVIARMLERGVNCPRTTSAGRLFDASAALIGLKGVCSFRGEAPGLLENLAGLHQGTEDGYRMELRRGDGILVLDWLPMMKALLADHEAGLPSGVISMRLHAGLCEGIVLVAREAGIEKVLLTGGCFANRLLTRMATDRLREEGFTPLRHHLVPPGDGGLSLGQTIAGAEIVAVQRRSAP